MESKLHVFRNDCDWYVAISPEDAAQACQEVTGLDPDEIDAFRPLDDDSDLLIRDDDGNKTVKTCAEWARENGRGFLCSTEW